MKQIKYIRRAAPPHMVGDGFKVRTFISSAMWKDMSPFLMLDYIEPTNYLPTDHPRGVDVHPHKGFETVSILWEGALAHEDSSGGKGKLFAGDVQWMTAGAGILHKEFHEEEFSKKGGVLHGAQLWVNLPAKNKSTAPAYQDISSTNIPEIALPDEKGKIRIIAGTMNGVKGPANTFTRINIFDAHVHANADFEFNVTEGDHTTVLVLKGTALVNDDKTVREGDMLIFDNAGESIRVQTNNETHLLLLSGEPINEPVAAYGPFVMNTQQEIIDAIDDFNAGKFGHLN
ncbi:pirin family protein [Lacibacter luteus]|uniref:Pirin family protein n=1 Tax=Lacibacter luteus TaxID=2508719 RepID=A0A4Q1CH84_9BACT|nr:pirin family protein [Lacibacter luteus]RXK59668.1 pirin family protein [Lacibacter luteus]